MEFLLGLGATLYTIGLLFGLLIFCLHIGLEPSNIPFPLRLIVALLAAILWPLGFALYGPLMSWKEKHDQRKHDKRSARREAEREARQMDDFSTDSQG